jgi:HAD superfamily hydrolase (TIGR01509 family)
VTINLGVIFDCDGTLVDSERLCNLVLAEALADLGVQETEGELLGRYRGARMAYILADLERRHSLRLPLTFEPRYRSRVASRFETELAPNPGVRPLLYQLRERATLAVASSAPREKIELALRVTDISFAFGANIYSSYELGSWKPEPDLFLHAAQSLGLPPSRCSVVEDSLPGAEAASRAGMRCFLYDPGHQFRESEVFGATPFHDMAELPKRLALGAASSWEAQDERA